MSMTTSKTATSVVGVVDDDFGSGDFNTNETAKWIRLWVTLLAAVVAIVAIYLLTISNSLSSVNKNLGLAATQVSTANGNTKSLPQAIQFANTGLVAVDAALAKVPGQADTIVSALSSINSKLSVTDASLKDTASSLVDTAGVLNTVLGSAGSISQTLVHANLPAGDCNAGGCLATQVGVQNIHQRLIIANGVLTTAKADTGNIIAGLVDVNSHLTSVCRAAVVHTKAQPC